MVGVVTTRHLLTHSTVIIQEFGARCFMRCVWRTLTRHHNVTFLECAVPMLCEKADPAESVRH